MQDQERENQGFDLEDILREFGQDLGGASEAPQEEPDIPQEPEEPEAGVVPEEPYEPTTSWDPAEVTGEKTAPGLEDTIRLDPPIQEEKPAGAEAFSMTQEELQEEVRQELQEGEEPYSQGWEPEYEQPMGAYVPPEPIVFRPKSRLRELKRQLIAGPEKRYYELSELGTGKLQACIFLNLLVVILSAGATVMYAAGWVQPERLKLMVFGQFFAMLLSALLGSQQMVEGLADLGHKRFTLNTLLAFTFIACCADGVLGLRELRVPCCAAFSLETTMALLNTRHRRTAEQGQMDTLRKAVRLDSVTACPEYLDGRPGYLKGEGQVADFMDSYQAPSKVEKIQNVYALAALGVSLAAGIAAGALHGVSFGVQVLAVSLLAAVPGSFFVSYSRPFAVLTRRLHKLGTVLCGWQGVVGLCGKAAFPLSHKDLFPDGCIKMNGVKFYGSRDTDQVVAYATALITAQGGGLAPLFSQLLESRNGRHYDVENLRPYPGGIGGEVAGEPVVMGILSFMQDMGVEIPGGTMVDQAVYLAIDGELCGLFAFTYDKTKDSAAGITTLCAYRSLQPVMVTGDFMLTDSFIKAKFGVNTRRIAFPEPAVRGGLERKQAQADAPALALMTQEGLSPMAYAVTGARALRTAVTLGLVIHLLGGILGLVMMAVLAVLGAQSLLTPVNLFLYQLVWMVPGLLLTEWTRNI